MCVLQRKLRPSKGLVDQLGSTEKAIVNLLAILLKFTLLPTVHLSLKRIEREAVERGQVQKHSPWQLVMSKDHGKKCFVHISCGGEPWDFFAGGVCPSLI